MAQSVLVNLPSSRITIANNDNLFESDNVEGALTELKTACNTAVETAQAASETFYAGPDEPISPNTTVWLDTSE